MRIGIDIRKYSDFGIGTYIQNLLEEYSGTNELELTLFATDEQISRLSGSVRAIFIAENSAKYSLQELFSLSKKANGTNIDLLHVPHYTLPLHLRKKSVVTIHDLIHLRMPEYFSVSQKVYASFKIRHACRHSTHIIVDSEFTKKDILKSFAIDEKKITSVPLGVDLVFFAGVNESQKEAFKRKFGIRKPYILYTGSLKPHKNIPLLLHSFSAIRKSVDVQLMLTGEEVNAYPALRSLMETNGIVTSVIGAGRLSQQDLVTAYQLSEAVVLPSLYEGFGFSMLEAMASRVPALGANAASIPEVMGDAGILFDPFDMNDLTWKLLKVLDDRKLRKNLIEKGFERAKQFSWKKCAEQTMAVYKMAIS